MTESTMADKTNRKKLFQRLVQRHPRLGSLSLWYLWLVGGSAWAAPYRDADSIVLWGGMFAVGFALSYIATILLINWQHQERWVGT